MDKYYYKTFKFEAVIFEKSNGGIFLLPKAESFYVSFLKCLETLLISKKDSIRYPLLNLKNSDKPVEIINSYFFKKVKLVPHVKDRKEELEIISDKEKKEIIIYYSETFLVSFKKEIDSFNWDSIYGEIDIGGLIICPNWW